MGCNRFSTTPKWAAAWHRLRCTECRAAARADERIERGVAALRCEQPPAEGLAATLAVLAAAPVPSEAPVLSRTAGWWPKLAAGGAACAALGLLAGYLLSGQRPAIGPPNPTKEIAERPRGGLVDPYSSWSDSPQRDTQPKRTEKHKADTAAKIPPAVEKARLQSPRRKRIRVVLPRSKPVLVHRPTTTERTQLAMNGPAFGGANGQTAALMEQEQTEKKEQATVLAFYGVDGDRQVRYALTRKYVIDERAVEAKPAPQHVYVIDRVSVTPHEPRVASSPERAKESQVW